jgi:hypothetical protein
MLSLLTFFPFADIKALAQTGIFTHFFDGEDRHLLGRYILPALSTRGISPGSSKQSGY